VKEHPAPKRDAFDIQVRRERPRGFLGLTSEPLRETEKAVQVEYYSWLLWFPKSQLVRVDNQLWAPRHSVEAAKDHESATRA
jgi:hypothetical protein